MYSPKDRKTLLIETCLTHGLTAYYCSSSKGIWIPAKEYKAWQKTQRQQTLDPDCLPSQIDVAFVQPLFDAKAALCPEDGSYLSRAKVGYKPAFYVERCPCCDGIWLDHGEWNILEKLGFHTAIYQLFSPEWQTKVRKKELADQERQATVDKLGPELAQLVFDLADKLGQNPNGDFGVAYLMRRFEQTRGETRRDRVF
ncbi:MAG: zf-TFIIB domain-containing protein [Synechococcales cyanobacterium CRU_2_2]|nr:zf-TFIIB domain-containing protein [Synechococcales cyanobacterium CRU_2_2]